MSAPAPEAGPVARRAASASPVDRIVQLAILGVLAYSVAGAARDIRYIVANQADDAAYYLGVAENVAAGHGFTFDGLNVTNGFHPLWEFLLIGLRWLAPVSHEGMARIAWVAQSVLLAAAAWLLWRLVRRVAGAWPAAVAAVLFMGRLYYTGRSGMESALVLLFAVVLLERSERWRLFESGTTRGPFVWFGVATGLLLLSRLDTVFIGAAMGVGLALAAASAPSGERARRLRSLALAGVVSSALVVPYLADNLARFGHVLPISGALKSSFPHPGWRVPSFNVAGQDAAVLLLANALGAGFLVWRVVARRRTMPAFVRHGLTAFTAGVMAHDLYSALFMKWGVFGWHFIMARLMLCLLLPLLAARVLPALRGTWRETAWAFSCVALALVSLLPIVKRDWRTRYEEDWTVQAYEAARWVDGHLPANAVLAMRDAGEFGYFSHRRVINLDGLINSFAYQDSLRRGRFLPFLRAEGAEYFVQHAVFDRPDVTEGRYDTLTFASYSHLYDRPGGTVVLSRAAELYRSRPFLARNQRCVFLIWRLPPR